MMKFWRVGKDGSFENIENPLACRFGITEAIAGAIGTFLTADVGVGAATAGILGNMGAGIVEGGVIGAATNPKNPLKGAEFGAISGGVGAGAAPLIGELGLGATATDALSGAVGGAVGGAATGRNILSSAAEGGLAGAVNANLPRSTGGTGTSGGPAGSAVSTAAPAGVAAPAGAVDTVTITPEGAGGPHAGGFETPGLTSANAFGFTGTGTGGAAIPASADIGGIGGWLKDKPWLPSAVGIGLDALKGNQALPGQKNLQADAARLSGQGADLQSYFRSGTLPPGLAAGLKQATEAAKASIRSMYASSGESGSSAEQQDLAAVDERASAQGAQTALNLLQQGVSETGMADQLYLELMGQALQQDQQLGSAIASFSAGLVPAAPPKAA